MTETDYEALTDQIAKAEGVGQNPRSSARGVGQFMPETWLRTVKAHYNTIGMTDGQILDLRDDPKTARAMLGLLVRDNAAALQSYGHPITPANIYLANHFGAAGAHNLLTISPDTPIDHAVSPLVMKQNPDLNGKSVGQVIGSDAAKVGGDDLASMGFARPGSAAPSAAPDDIGSMGFATAPTGDIDKARGEIGLVKAAVPAADAVVAGANGIIAGGVKSGQSASQIKASLSNYLAKNGMDPTRANGLDEAIAYKQAGHPGAIPFRLEKMVRPAGTLDNALAGLKQGVEDVDASVINPAARLGIPFAQGASDKLRADRALFDATAGNTTAGNLGRLGGNVVTSAVPIAGANSLIARGAGRLAEAAPAAADAITFLGGNGGKALADESGNLISNGNLLARGASVAAHGALQGGEGALAVSGGSDAPISDQIATGVLTGSALAPGRKLLGLGGNAIARVAAPSVEPAVAVLAQRAKDFGINVRGSQISGSPFVRTLDSVLARIPGSGMAADNAGQRAQFTRAVGQTFGADAPNLTPEVMTNARNKISQVYEDVGNRTNVDVHPDTSPFLDDIGRIEEDARGVLDDNKIKPLRNLVTNITNKISPDGTIDGKVIQSLTQKGSMLDQATRDGNSSFANAAKALKGALNDALTESAAPEDAAALKTADWQWKNMRTVERLVASSPDGTISPALLNRPVSSSFTNRAYTGAGDLGDLAEIGQRFLKDQGSSNTAERSQQFNMLMNVAKGAGAVGGGLLGIKVGVSPIDLLGLGATGGATMGAANLAGRALKSDAYRNKLISAALDNNVAPTGSTWFNRNYIPLAVAGTNPLLTRSLPRGQTGTSLRP